MLWSSYAPKYPDGAWVGNMAPRDPGSATWKFKNLNAQTPDDQLTTTESANLKAKNANIYITVGGIAITMEGIVSSGEYLDIMRGTDKLQARIQENVYTALAQQPKIPFTNAGGDVLGNQVKAALTEMENDGLLSPGTSVVTVPDVSTIPPAQRALREFGDIEFISTYAGAVHKVQVKGTISV